MYTFQFDPTNNNALHIYEGERLHQLIAIPPGINRTDIFSFIPLERHNTNAIVIHTNEFVRAVYVRGVLQTYTWLK